MYHTVVLIDEMAYSTMPIVSPWVATSFPFHFLLTLSYGGECPEMDQYLH